MLLKTFVAAFDPDAKSLKRHAMTICGVHMEIAPMLLYGTFAQVAAELLNALNKQFVRQNNIFVFHSMRVADQAVEQNPDTRGVQDGG